MKKYSIAAFVVLTAVILLGMRGYDAYMSYDISYSDGTHKITTVTKLKTVGEWLNDKQIKVGDKDILTPDTSTLLKDGLAILIKRANTYKIVDLNKHSTYKSQATKVKDVLAEINIELGEQDYVVPELNSQLKDGDKVQIVRVETTIVKEYIDIPYQLVTYDEDSLDKGTKKLTQRGRLGKRQNLYVNVYENGKLVKHQYIDTEIVKKPVDERIAKGTYVAPKITLTAYNSTSSASYYTLGQFMYNGVVYYNGNKYTYYSQSVLPGNALYIPGRHVNAAGFVCDGDGYIVLAGGYSRSKGEIIGTPFGFAGKIYDTCPSCDYHWIDVYVR